MQSDKCADLICTLPTVVSRVERPKAQSVAQTCCESVHPWIVPPVGWSQDVRLDPFFDFLLDLSIAEGRQVFVRIGMIAHPHVVGAQERQECRIFSCWLRDGEEDGTRSFLLENPDIVGEAISCVPVGPVIEGEQDTVSVVAAGGQVVLRRYLSLGWGTGEKQDDQQEGDEQTLGRLAE